MSRIWELAEELRVFPSLVEARQKKELHLFDFDGTLFKSPEPPSWWLTGTKGWYSGQFSLDPPCVPEKPGPEWWIEPTVAAARKSIANPDVWAIMCTGRADNKLRWRIPQLLKQKNLDFDQVFLKDKGAGGAASGDDMKTAAWKTRLMIQLCRKFDCTGVQVWEDSNMDRFEAALKKAGYDFVRHDVKVKHPQVQCTPEDIERMDPKAYAKMVRQGAVPKEKSA